jgi:hypothetical protein
VALLNGSKGSPWPSEAASRRWHRQSLGASTHLLHEEDKQPFSDSPLAFGVFLGMLETTPVFATSGDLNLFK